MAKDFYKKLSERLKKAKEELEKSKKEAPPKKEEAEVPEKPSLPPSLPKKPSMPSVQAPQMPVRTPRVVEQPKILVAPPQQAPAPQAPTIAPTKGPAKPSIVKEREMGGISVTELEGEAPTTIKYKPISMEMPEEFEAGGGGEVVAKEYIQKLKKVDDRFPLINLTIKGEKVTVAWGRISWHDEINNLVYEVNEPPLNDKLKKVLQESKTLLRQKLDIDFTKIRVEKAYEYLMNRFDEISNEIAPDITSKDKIVLQYYVFRDFIGLGRIEALLHDQNIEDIHCDGFNIPLFITHRNPTYGELQTNILFQTKEELDSFVLRLAQKCGKALSVAEPLMDGSLPDGSRVQITYGTDIAMRGSNFTIRKFTEKPITPVDELDFGTASPEICAYLWMAVESGLSIMVAGATATGKTSFLNALSLFIKPELKIISIEDTPELRLPHPNWIPVVARGGFGVKGYGEVTMFDLLKSALRQRPNFVIVGEVRGKEAYVMFQGMATGHPSMGTLHADSLPAVIDRLTTEPINIPKPMLENLDLIVFLVQTKRKGEYVRRVNETVEIVGYNPQNRNLITNRSFRWDSENDRFLLLKSILLDKIREKMGYSVGELKSDLVRRIKLLKWLQENRVKDYREVARYFNLYYTNPERVEKLVRRSKK
ncbi:type IV secretion system protein VirB11 [archaeon]|nr:type IV secretion system protein VirB11 [archaeon]